jgi:hypothetical protein
MDIEGFSIPEPHRDLQEQVLLKNQLDRLLQSPLVQIERQRAEIRRLTEPLSLPERTLHQTHLMELSYRTAAEIGLSQVYQMESLKRVAMESTAEALLHKRSPERPAPMFIPPQTLIIGPSLRDRIEALEREVRQLKSEQKPPPPPPEDGENRSYGQYL